ncbi:MAG: FprA family A-type flavoprotein [Dehalococcoidia bacterium]|nr:FprA family A-type flavoprotein [Dehalococcoidia bacterium]
MSKVIEMAPNIFWVGATDWHRRVFDGYLSLPYGTSYNSYLVRGAEKVALIDTVYREFEDTLLEKVGRVLSPANIDYVIMNHAEPDHGGAIPTMMAAAPSARLVTTKRGAEMASLFYNVAPERCQVVADGDTLDLGGRTLQFLDTPWLHWPETMTTFCPEEGALFPCDFLGAHLASDKLFADEVGGLSIPEAKRYYASIMMPFAKSALRALDKFDKLDVRLLAPSHGPVHKDPGSLFAAQRKWAGGPLENKVVILFATMYGSTEKLKQAMVGALSAGVVEVVEYDLAAADLSHIAADLVDAKALVVGSPTFIGGAHPLVHTAVETVRLLRPPGKLAALFGSSGWSGGAAAHLKARLESAGYTVLDPVEIKGPPGPADLEAARALGRQVAERLLAE